MSKRRFVFFLKKKIKSTANRMKSAYEKLFLAFLFFYLIVFRGWDSLVHDCRLGRLFVVYRANERVHNLSAPPGHTAMQRLYKDLVRKSNKLTVHYKRVFCISNSY